MTLTADRLQSVTLDLDELDLLTHLIRIDELPVVLAATSGHDTVAARDAAFAQARVTLAERGLLPGTAPHPDLVDRLTILSRPTRELAVRWYTGGGVSRMCLARHPSATVLALRGPASVTLAEVPEAQPDLLLEVIGRATGLDVDPVSAPTDRLATALGEISDPPALARALSGLGARDPERLAFALATCRAHAEIVTIVRGEGRQWTSSPVTVFDTDTGRLVGTSSAAADGTGWSTLGPGGDARVRQAVRDLLAWVPPTPGGESH